MRLFVDCEFNSRDGDLISMSLVSEDGKHEFYEVVELKGPVNEWVKDNVYPVINYGTPLTFETFQNKLKTFMGKFANIVIMADYPVDVMHVCRAMETGPGEWFEFQPMTMVIDDDLSAKGSKVPHNALEDARALRLSWMKKEGFLNE